MNERMDVPSQPTMTQPSNGGEAADSDKCSFLEVCEFAYRELANNAPLSLSDAEFHRDAIEHHLVVEQCATCLRAYRNAKRAYARLIHDGASPPRVVVPTADVVVPPFIAREAKRFSHAEGQEIQYRIEPAERGTGFNALAINLVCIKKPFAGWEITLLLNSWDVDPAGNDPVTLQTFNDYWVTLQLKPKQGEPMIWEPRLGIDPQGCLISSPCSLRAFDPQEIASITILRWKKRQAL